jgi:predicted transcriptional regulator
MDGLLSFPDRVYTKEEVEKARSLIAKGYKHDLKVDGSQEFVGKVGKALSLIKSAGYYDFVRTYIRTIRELTDGLSQLRQEEVAIWFNVKALDDPVDDAGFIIQKTQQMKDFVEGKLYYETAEAKAVDKRLEFVEALRDKTADPDIKKRCEENLKRWKDQPFP